MSHGALGYQYKKDDDWLLSASMSAKSFADFGGLGAADYASGGNTAALRPSLSQDQLRASLPSLKIRSQERNPVLGCMPHDVIDTTDYVPTSHRLHGPMMLSKPRAAGSTTRFGVIDTTGKIEYLPKRYGTAEALNQTDAAAVYGRPKTSASASSLRPSPSMQELDALLARRSRVRGRGGSCTAVVDVVQTKWNVMNGGPSSMSVMRPPLARD